MTLFLLLAAIIAATGLSSFGLGLFLAKRLGIIHTLVNNRSQQQDDKIAALEKELILLHDLLRQPPSTEG